MRKSAGAIFLILGGVSIATVLRSVILRSVAGRSPEYMQVFLWFVFGTALLHWGSRRLANWALSLGLICVLLGGYNLARALSTAEVPSPDVSPTPISIEFRLIDDASDSDSPGTPLRGTEEVLHLESTVLLTEENIASARKVPVKGSFDVALDLTREGARKFESLTGANIGRRLGIMVDGVLLTAPVIRQRISGGGVNIPTGFSEEEAARIVHRINGDMDLMAAARPGGTIAGVILLACGSVLILLRGRIPANALTRFAGIVFLLVGVLFMFVVLINVVLSIITQRGPDSISLLFLFAGLAMLIWGSKIARDWRIPVGMACLVFGISLLILPTLHAGRFLPTGEDPFGWPVRIVLGCALGGTGALLIAAWRRERRGSPTQNEGFISARNCE